MSKTEECPYCGVNCKVGYGKCHCGCGRTTKPHTNASAMKINKTSNVPIRPICAGVPKRTILWHRAPGGWSRRYTSIAPGLQQ